MMRLLIPFSHNPDKIVPFVWINSALDNGNNLYLEISGIPMGNKIKGAYETVGSNRIMFGIDSPFHHPTVEIQKVLTCTLDKKAQENIFL